MHRFEFRDASARNAELEAALIDDPRDRVAWQVYADWLETQADPWGERLSLALQHGNTKGASKTKLAKQIEAYDKHHAEALYGESLAGLMHRGEFAQTATIDAPFGMIMEARVKAPEHDWKGTAPNTVLAALLESPAARLLRSLSIGLIDHEYPVKLGKGIEAIIEAGKLESLRELFIGDFEYPDENEISWVEVGNVAEIYLVVPNLRSLRLRGAGIELGKLEHDELRRLTIETGGLPSSSVASLGAAVLPQLVQLVAWLGTSEYGGDGKVSQLAGLFAGEGVPKLDHLGLKNSDFEDDIAIALCQSKLLPRLRSVDLSMGTLHEPGAEAILASIDDFKHLDTLTLDENFIPDDLCERLQAQLGDKLSIGEQQAPDDWDDEPHYYTSVSE